MTSGVHADKAGRVKGRYNRASLSTRALAELWTLGGGATGPLGAVLDGPEAEARLAAAIGAPGHNGFSREELQARLAHFVGENRRVDQALHAFREASAERLGALAAASQADAGALLGNQVEETDALTSAALGAGAFAASSFGAGFGGSVWALIDHADAARYAGEWEARYRTSCPGANPVEWFATRPGPAALEVALNES
jgi:galactokinase